MLALVIVLAVMLFLVVLGSSFLISIQQHRPKRPCLFATAYAEWNDQEIGRGPCSAPEGEYVFVSLDPDSRHLDGARVCGSHTGALERLSTVHTGYWWIAQ